MRGEQRGSNDSQCIIDPKQYIIVPETKHAITMLVKTPAAGVIVCLLIEMLAAVQFNHQMGLQADEVCIEIFDVMLATEFEAK